MVRSPASLGPVRHSVAQRSLSLCALAVLATGASGWTGPSVAVNGDDETIVVFEADGAVAGLVFGPGGEPRTLEPIPLALGHSAFVAAAQDGRGLALVYVTDGSVALAEGRFTDTGVTLADPRAADPAEPEQRSPRVAFHGPERLVLAWTDDRRGPRGLSVQLRRSLGTVVLPRVEAAGPNTAVMGPIQLDGDELVLTFIDRGARDVVHRKVLDLADELAVLDDDGPLFVDRGDTGDLCSASLMGVSIVGQVDMFRGELIVAITDGGPAPRATGFLPLSAPGGCAAVADRDGYTVMVADGNILRALRFDALGDIVGQWGLRLGNGTPLRDVAAARRAEGTVVAFTYGDGELGVVFLDPEPSDQQRCDATTSWFEARTCCIDGDWVVAGDQAEGGCLVCDPDEVDTAWSCQDAGVACDESDLCTQGSCTAQCTCEIEWERDCSALDRSCWTGGCDAATGECRRFLVPQGSPCDPGPCTTNGFCEWGVCRGGRPRDCRDLNLGCDIGICDEQTGRCEVEVRNDGEVCDPIDPCFEPGVCLGGECLSDAEVDCSGIDSACYAGVCDASSGTCREVILPDGTPCDDQNRCTADGACHAGRCEGGTPTDEDADGLCSNRDNCPDDRNPDQSDADLDGRGDVCDVCPSDAANTDDGCPVTSADVGGGADVGADSPDVASETPDSAPPPAASASPGGCGW